MDAMTKFVLTGLISLLALSAAPEANAQTYEEYEAEEQGEKPKVKRAVREIVKGTYAKTNVGATLYLGRYAPWVRPGTSIALAVGQDFMDTETMSMAWEISFFQGINNGTAFEDQAVGNPEAGLAPCMDNGSCVQGDLRTYTLVGIYEASFYPTRRLGIGLRAGGGMLFSPLTMDETFYNREVVGIPNSADTGAWGTVPSEAHDQPHPVVLGGPTIEYYTKLSHFSAGIDADIFYAVGFDLGVSAAGTLKYTF
jgi:hypothetical protein